MENSEVLPEDLFVPAIAANVAPFDHDTADLICRSSDLIDFRVYSSLVARASYPLQGMLSLPVTKIADTSGGASQAPPQEFKDNLPVVPFPDEDWKTLYFLLHSCHKFDEAYLPPLNIDELEGVCVIHDKFAVTTFSRAVMKACLAVAKDDPVAAFALACAHKLDEFRDEVAKLTLDKPLMPFSRSPELTYITGLQHSQLLQYHLDCQGAASELATKDWTWIPSVADVPLGDTNSACYTCRMKVTLNSSSIQSGVAVDTATGTNYFYAPKWWYKFMQETAAAALKERPCGNTLRDRELRAEALKDAVSCGQVNCRSGVVAMMDFCERFADAVDEAIAKVCPARLRLLGEALIIVPIQVPPPF